MIRKEFKKRRQPSRNLQAVKKQATSLLGNEHLKQGKEYRGLVTGTYLECLWNKSASQPGVVWIRDEVRNLAEITYATAGIWLLLSASEHANVMISFSFLKAILADEWRIDFSRAKVETWKTNKKNICNNLMRNNDG